MYWLALHWLFVLDFSDSLGVRLSWDSWCSSSLLLHPSLVKQERFTKHACQQMVSSKAKYLLNVSLLPLALTPSEIASSEGRTSELSVVRTHDERRPSVGPPVAPRSALRLAERGGKRQRFAPASRSAPGGCCGLRRTRPPAVRLRRSDGCPRFPDL